MAARAPRPPGGLPGNMRLQQGKCPSGLDFPKERYGVTRVWGAADSSGSDSAQQPEMDRVTTCGTLLCGRQLRVPRSNRQA